MKRGSTTLVAQPLQIYYHYASTFANAARTNATKSGCGLRTVLLYSGWYCVPTNHGWSATSTTSTNPVSGLTPAALMPAASYSSR